MLAYDEKKMLKVVAAYNDTTEDMAKEGIIKEWLNTFLTDESSPIRNMELKYLPKAEQPKPRKKPGPKPKAERMTKTEFVGYLSEKQDREIERARSIAAKIASEEAEL